MDNTFQLSRFTDAQESSYDGYQTALGEIRQGRKCSHWVWYIFPQMRGLGRSSTSEYYGITGIDEARAYLADNVLGARLREISEALLAHKGQTAKDILGGIDAQKVMSSMTLFDAAEPDSVFAEVLEAFYGGRRDRRTLAMLGQS